MSSNMQGGGGHLLRKFLLNSALGCCARRLSCSMTEWRAVTEASLSIVLLPRFHHLDTWTTTPHPIPSCQSAPPSPNGSRAWRQSADADDYWKFQRTTAAIRHFHSGNAAGWGGGVGEGGSWVGPNDYLQPCVPPLSGCKSYPLPSPQTPK